MTALINEPGLVSGFAPPLDDHRNSVIPQPVDQVLESRQVPVLEIGQHSRRQRAAVGQGGVPTIMGLRSFYMN